MELFRALMGAPIDCDRVLQRDPSPSKTCAREMARPPDDAVMSGRLWTPGRCKTQWTDSVFVVYGEAMSSLSGVYPVAFPITADDNPCAALVTPRRVGAEKERKRQANARNEAIAGSIATPRGKQWLQLDTCERCVEVAFAGSFSGLGTRREQPGFTLLGFDGMCYHFAAETFAERSKWVKMLAAALRIQHRMPDCIALNTVRQAESRMLGENDGNATSIPTQRGDGSEGKAESNGATPASGEPGLVEALAEAHSELCVEREVSRRLDLKVRILERGILEVRDESDGLRSALMAALDRLSMFSSNSVPSPGIVAASSGNWLQNDSLEKQVDAKTLLMLDKVAHLDATLQTGLRVSRAQMKTLQTNNKHSLDGGDKSRGDELAREVAVLKRQVQDLTSKLNIAQSDAEAYEKALGASKSAAEEVKHANKLLQAQQIGAWSLELSAVTCELQSAYQQVEVFKTELIASNKRAMRLQEESKLVQERRQVADDEVGTLKKQLERATSAHKEAQDALAKCEGERSRLEAELSHAAARASPEISAKEEKPTAESDFLNRQNERLLQQVASLEELVVRGEKALAHTKADLEAEHFHRQDLQVKVVERDRKISTIEEENMMLLSDRRELDAQRQTLQAQLELLLTAEKQANANEALLQGQLNTALVQERHLRDEVATLQVMLQERDREVEGMRKGNNDARRTQVGTQAAMDEMMKASDESIRTIAVLENIMTRLARELNQLLYERNKAEAEVAALQVRTQTMQAEVDNDASIGAIAAAAIAPALVKNPSPKTTPTSGPTPSGTPSGCEEHNGRGMSRNSIETKDMTHTASETKDMIHTASENKDNMQKVPRRFTFM